MVTRTLCEDFVEHVSQADALIFLCEVHRTLNPGGVLRLAAPSLEGLLARHYAELDFNVYAAARREAFAELGHVHYFSKSSLELVARHVGFSVEYVEVGKSAYPELCNVNARVDPINFHAELTKL